MAISRYCATKYKGDIGYLYTLRNPYNGHIFYVGKTVNRYGRLMSHIGDSKSRHSKKDEYIDDIVQEGKKPIMGIIETHNIRTQFDKYYYEYREAYFIRTYLEYGWELTNIRLNEAVWAERTYKKTIREAKNGGGLEPSDFYFKLDEKGFPIYDLRMIDKLGYSFSKEQFASHWAYILDIEKYKDVKETTLDYVYGDTICEQNRNINYYNALDEEPDTETMFKRFY